jgi:DNA-binding NtrC family response regulator
MTLTQEEQGKIVNFVGKSRPVRELFRVIEKVADTDRSVLITGEPGTGKQLIAEAIHYNSKRRDKPKAIIDCLLVPEELVEINLC